MGSAVGGSEVTEMDGIIPRCCADLFASIDEKCDGNAKVELSYLEIYNEEINDLLAQTPKPLKIRETLDGEVYVSGLESRVVASPKEIGAFMDEAASRRNVASTAMNAVSSRSHAICTLNISGVTESADGVDKFSSKLVLVDLAGSERIKKTGAVGGRRQEGININKGLFILGQVVSALSERGKGGKLKRKPPYRDSKLTRLLQDSLGGNSRTIMVACVSPADYNIDESVNTMRYATSARNIKNTATRNLVKNISPEEAAKLQRENQLLKQQVKELTETVKNLAGNKDGVSFAISDDEISVTSAATAPLTSLEGGEEHSQRVHELEKEVEALKRELKAAKGDVRKSVTDSAIELPAMKVELAQLKEELEQAEALAAENEDLRMELDDAKADAESARLAAAKLSDIMDKLKELKKDELDKKRVEYNHMKKEEAWVSFVFQMLNNHKDQMARLHEDFDLVLRIVESPTMMTVPGQKPKRNLWNTISRNLTDEQVCDPELRQQLLRDHVNFFCNKMKEIENEIKAESHSLKQIRDGIKKDRERLQCDIGMNEFVNETLKTDDADLLHQLTEMLIGPVKMHTEK